MNIIFFGTSEFAVESLRAILESNHKVSLVVTQPDRKKGRKLVLSAPPVKALAEHSLTGRKGVSSFYQLRLSRPSQRLAGYASISRRMPRIISLPHSLGIPTPIYS